LLDVGQALRARSRAGWCGTHRFVPLLSLLPLVQIERIRNVWKTQFFARSRHESIVSLEDPTEEFVGYLIRGMNSSRSGKGANSSH
jgi:hypothetical protein